MSKKLAHWIVYGLFDPTTGEIRYVGQTSYALHHRLSRHLYEARNLKVCDHKCAWINGLLDLGLRPVIGDLEVVHHADEVAETEDFYIRYLRAMGANLFNEAFGGDGSIGRRLREETKLKISASQSGRISPLKGRTISDETKAKISKAKMGIPSIMKGKKFPPEFAQKLRDVKSGAWINPLKGKPRSAETKAKISASKLGRTKAVYPKELSVII